MRPSPQRPHRCGSEPTALRGVSRGTGVSRTGVRSARRARGPAEQRAEIGSDAYHGLMVDERSLAINPARYVSGLAAAAGRAGALIVVSHAEVSASSAIGSALDASHDRGDDRRRRSARGDQRIYDRAVPGLRRRLVPIGSYIVATATARARRGDEHPPEAADGVRLEIFPAITFG